MSTPASTPAREPSKLAMEIAMETTLVIGPHGQKLYDEPLSFYRARIIDRHLAPLRTELSTANARAERLRDALDSLNEHELITKILEVDGTTLSEEYRCYRDFVVRCVQAALAADQQQEGKR